MGKVVLILVGASMFAFILTDLFRSPALLGGNDNIVAEISGREIPYEEFQEKVNELAYIFAVNQGREAKPQEMDEVRDQAWNALVLENAYSTEYAELGIEVTDLELVDMVQGDNIHPQIKQFFADPNTGEFTKENVVNFLRQINSAPARQKASWLTFENNMKPSRMANKYAKLIAATSYVTKEEGKNKYVGENSNMTVDFFYVPFFSLKDDSLFEISDSEMKSYLSRNSDDYQREESRSLSYVTFPIEPSAGDSAFVKEEIERLRDAFATTENDSLFALRNSDSDLPFRSFNDPAQIPPGMAGAEIGTISAPRLSGNKYVTHKLVDIFEGDEAFVKGRHILIKTNGTGDAAKEKARDKAKALIEQLRRGADFSELAAINSEDKSNSANGGDLGWFGENGSFVQPFKDAAFGHKGTGLVPDPVETSFGYHIIRIDEPKTYTAYKLATIEKELFASDVTLNESYRQADMLASNSHDLASFEAYAEEHGLQVRTASNIGKKENRVGVISGARKIVLWLYNQAEPGKVSEIMEFEDKYVVAVMTGLQEEGTARPHQVRNEIRNKILNEKKAARIKEKILAIDSDDFEEMKDAYGSDDVKTGSADLVLGNNSFPNIGFAPEAVGIAFSLEAGERTAPFDVSNGVIILSATAKDMAEDLADYSTYTAQVENARRGGQEAIANFPLTFSPVLVPRALDEAVKQYAGVEDKRHKFF